MIEDGTTSSGRMIEKVIIRPHVIQTVRNGYHSRAVTCTGNSARLVGVLLGISSSNGAIVNVTNSYEESVECGATVAASLLSNDEHMIVPFQEDEDDPRLWVLDQNFHESRYSMFRRINAKQHLVGWYSTGANLQENDSEIHKLFDVSVPNPVLVKINVQPPKEQEEPTKAYYAVKDIEKCNQVFVHVPSEIGALYVDEVGKGHLLIDVEDTTNTPTTEPDIHVIVSDFLQGTSNLLPSLNLPRATEDDLLSAEPPKDNSDATLLTRQHKPKNNGIHPMTLSSPGASAEIVPGHTSIRSEIDLEFQSQALRQARNEVTVVAGLIATLTASAGISLPGGYNQATGKAMLSKQTSFQVFSVCNIVALFSSLAIVITFVGIIPFMPDNMERLLMLSHKVMWFSMMSMAAAFIAATWSTIPYAEGTEWVPVTSLAVGVGCSLSIFAGLLILKLKHRVERRRSPKDNSDATPLSLTMTLSSPGASPEIVPQSTSKIVREDNASKSTNNGIDPKTLSSPGASPEIVPESTSKIVREDNASTSTNNGIDPKTLSSPGASPEIVPESTSKIVHEDNASTSKKIPSKGNRGSDLPPQRPKGNNKRNCFSCF
ncbi:hypothetical protein Ancab_002140 [Ancistrocladus abbreviatus]